MLGGPRGVVEITAAEYQLAAPGPTFAGRDVMAPAAAHLAAGVPIDALGPEIDPVAPDARAGPAAQRRRRRARSRARSCGSTASATASSTSRPSSSRTPARTSGDALEVTVSDAAGVQTGRRARWVRTFADAKPSELVVLVDSYGMCALALDRRSAALDLGVRAGSAVTLATEPPRLIGLHGRRSGRPRAQGASKVRAGTSLVLAALLVLILVASIVQFALRM